MTYDEFVTDVVKVVEVAGAAIMAVAGLGALVVYGDVAYGHLRRRLGQVIRIGLDVLIVGVLVRDVILDRTVENAVVLGLIVAIRIVFSFANELEIEGTWPWSRRRSGQSPEVGDSDAHP